MVLGPPPWCVMNRRYIQMIRQKIASGCVKWMKIVCVCIFVYIYISLDVQFNYFLNDNFRKDTLVLGRLSSQEFQGTIFFNGRLDFRVYDIFDECRRDRLGLQFFRHHRFAIMSPRGFLSRVFLRREPP